MCYPAPSLDILKKRLVEAKMMGVRYIFLEGRTEVEGLRVLGKGTTSIVVKALVLRGGLAALKIRRLDSNRPSVISEAMKLKMANSVGVGPRLLAYSRNMIAWEYVEGKALLDSWRELRDENEKARIIKDLLVQAYRLDRIGLSHKELSMPKHHILITDDGRPVIIDFESASVRSGKSNLTQIMGFLLKDKDTSAFLKRKGAVVATIRELLRQYKRGKCGFGSILRELNLE